MLTAVILTKNEEVHLSACIDSLSFCDNIIVLDDHSTDRTMEIAREKQARVIPVSQTASTFSEKRNSVFTHMETGWILFIDADERISPELAQEIQKVVNTQSEVEGYSIRRRDHFWGKILSHGELKKAYNSGFIRLVKKGKGEWVGNVHEALVAHGPVQTLSGFIDHYPHPTITEFLQSINTYSTLRARELHKSHKKASMGEILVYPFAKFVYTYCILAGLLDGAAGFVYSFMMSFHSFLVRSKLYQYQQEKQ